MSWHWWHPLVLIFGNRAVWDLPWPFGKLLSKSQVCIIHWRLLGVLVPLRPLYHISQTLNFTWIACQLSVFVSLLHPCSHGPAKWVCWCCSWPLAALKTALKLLMLNQPVTNITTPTFEQTTSDQYDGVQTLSWVHGELVPSSGNIRWAWWQRCPPGVYTKSPQYHSPPEMEPVDTCHCDHRWNCSYQEEHEILPGSLSISDGPYCVWWCQIYQLENVQIKPGETPDELVDCLRALANRCNFPTDEEWNVQFCLVHALTDSELVKKLLALDLKATTAKMLETCRTHIAIADNLNGVGLRSKTVNAVKNRANNLSPAHNNSNKNHLTPRTNMHAGITQNPMHLVEPPALLRTLNSDHVAE